MTYHAQRALRALLDGRAVIALSRDGAGFGVYTQGDQRRRAAVELTRAQVEAWREGGLIEACGRNLFRLTPAGRSQVEAARPPRRTKLNAPPRLLREYA